MIVLSSQVTSGVKIPRKFSEMLEFFNKLEKSLEYPQCEGYSDQKFVLEQAVSQFERMQY